MLVNFTNGLMIGWYITNYFNDVSNLLTTIFIRWQNFQLIGYWLASLPTNYISLLIYQHIYIWLVNLATQSCRW